MLQTVTYYTHAIIRCNLPIFDRICHKGLYGTLGTFPVKSLHPTVTIGPSKPRIVML